jgi:GNAT superfamily N-acetyltransferase
MFRALRLASLQDSPGAFASTFEQESRYPADQWRRGLRDRTWLLATLGDQPIGLAGGGESWDGTANERDLVGMWVSPPHRRRGVAIQLLAAIKDWAQSDGADTLALWVVDNNTVAHSAYRGYGFVPVATASLDRAPEITTTKFVLQLAPLAYGAGT